MADNQAPSGGASTSQSLADRIRALPQEATSQLLSQIRCSGEAAETGEEGKGWGFARVPWEYMQQPGLYLESLRGDRWFKCPDGMDGMAEAFRVAGQMEGLRGSTQCALPTEEQAAGIKSLNASLRGESKRAWSQEAVLKGVQLAKAGDYSRARSCYDQALELHAENVDALVARGAAYANQSRFRQAVQDFQQALEIDPDHPNAAGYLSATRQKLNAEPSGKRDNGAVGKPQREPDGTSTPGAPKASKFDLESELQEAFASVKRKHGRKDSSAAKDRRAHKSKKKRRHDAKAKKRRSSKSARRSRSAAKRSRSPPSSGSTSPSPGGSASTG